MMSSDLTAKYGRLAQEYAKIKAQNQVLRKAVLEEQDNCNLTKDAMRSKEQLLRRSEQEMDSLMFRNQQMEKRVELLQEELEKVSNSKGKKKVKSENHAVAQNHNSAVDEDLRNKIRENEILHKQVHEADTKTRQLERELSAEVTKARRETKQYRDLLETADEKHNALVNNLQQDRGMLELRLKETEDDRNKVQIEADKSSMELKTIRGDLGSEVTQLNRVVQDTIVFNDCASPHYTVLNIPPHDRRSQSKAQTLLKDANAMVSELCKGLMNLHSNTEQRSRMFPIDASFNDITPANAQLCKLLNDCAMYVRPMGEAFSWFNDLCANAGASPVSLHTAVGLEKFSQAFDKYCAYLDRIVPYQLISIQEECAAAVCAPTLQSKNMEFEALFRRLPSAFNKMKSYLHLVASCGSSSRALPSFNEKAAFEKILTCLNELHLLFKDLSKVFNAKVAIEHQLPTSSEKLKHTDEFLLSAYLSLATNTAKIAAFVSENIDFFTQSSTYRTRGVSLMQTQDDARDDNKRPSASYSIIELCKRSCSYLQRINPTAAPRSVPYDQSLQDHATALASSQNNTGLLETLEEARGRISSLEQEKEHWLLEAQLLRMKLDRIKQKADPAIIAEASSLERFDERTKRDRNNSANITVDTSMLGNVEICSDVSDNTDIETREETIKRHLTSRLTETSSKLQLAESKSLHLHTECQALHKRLDLSSRSLETLQENNNKSNQRISQLQDELQVTRKNYEDQLSLMSDHLASMNDKLTNQKDEIDNLKLKPSKLSKFRSKKGHN